MAETDAERTMLSVILIVLALLQPAPVVEGPLLPNADFGAFVRDGREAMANTNAAAVKVGTAMDQAAAAGKQGEVAAVKAAAMFDAATAVLNAAEEKVKNTHGALVAFAAIFGATLPGAMMYGLQQMFLALLSRVFGKRHPADAGLVVLEPAKNSPPENPVNPFVS